MSCPIDWKLRVRRKDGYPISRDEIEMLFNNERWNCVLGEENFTCVYENETLWEAQFFTESNFADNDIMKVITQMSRENKEFKFQTIRNYCGDESYLTDYEDGTNVTAKGYMVYGGMKEW